MYQQLIHYVFEPMSMPDTVHMRQVMAAKTSKAVRIIPFYIFQEAVSAEPPKPVVAGSIPRGPPTTFFKSSSFPPLRVIIAGFSQNPTKASSRKILPNKVRRCYAVNVVKPLTNQ